MDPIQSYLLHTQTNVRKGRLFYEQSNNAYVPLVRDTMDYFRAVFSRNELSDRALEITAEAIRLNPANYTAWYASLLPS